MWAAACCTLKRLSVCLFIVGLCRTLTLVLVVLVVLLLLAGDADESRGLTEEPAPGGPGGSGRGAGASSPAGDLLELFVESVRLLASLCQERHEGNIALVRSLKGTTYEVCVCAREREGGGGGLRIKVLRRALLLRLFASFFSLACRVLCTRVAGSPWSTRVSSSARRTKSKHALLEVDEGPVWCFYGPFAY